MNMASIETIRSLLFRVRGLFHKKQLDKELSSELESHLQLHIEDNLRSGMSPAEARRNALLKLGGVQQTKESVRDAKWLSYLESFFRDLRFGIRQLRKNPGFTTVAVLTLALGIGANTAIFSLIDIVMLKMLPVQKPEELVLLAVRSPVSDSGPDFEFSNPVWEQIRNRQDIFSGIFASSDSNFDLAQEDESHSVSGLYVGGEFFNTLGVYPAAGRLLTSADDVRSCAGAAVLSYGFWQEHYGGAESAVGSMVSLNHHSFQVIGVARRGFFGVTVGKQFDVAIPVCAAAIIPIAGEPDGTKFLDRPSAQWLRVMARPKPGFSLKRVTARLQVLSPEVFATTVSQEWRPELQRDFLAGKLLALPGAAGFSDLRQGYDQPLKTLMAVVALVLLIACANIASLMLARASARRKEIAVRLAVGASRSRLVCQLLTECVLLSSFGALLGILLARWGCAILVRLISTSNNPVFLQLSLDGHILGFTAGVAVLTGLLFGVLPALRSTRVSLTSAMKGGRPCEMQGYSHLWSGRWIVASQVALSLVILITAGLFLRTFKNLLTLDLGFDRSNVLLIETSIPHPNISQDQRAALARQILGRLSSLPGVLSASESLVTPISGNMWGTDFYLEKGGGPSGKDAGAYMNFVSPGYFATLHTPLHAGRIFDERDAAGAQPVVIINEAMARRFFPGSHPLGQYLQTYDFINARQAKITVQVVGILKDTKYQSLREAAKSIVYFPIAQSEALTDPPIFEIRTAAQPSLLARSAEEVINELNRNISLNFRTLESQVNDSLQRERLLATLSGFFGGLALLLAMIGLYGVISYIVTLRRVEIGIRMALGANRQNIVAIVLGQTALVLAIGIAMGAILALAAVRGASSLLFEVQLADPLTMVGAGALLTGAALSAGFVPALRATRVDPIVALRYE